MNANLLELASDDPRPRVTIEGGGVTIRGWRCVDCAYPLIQPVLRCPICKGDIAGAEFATAGEVWASTVLRVPVPGYPPPFGLAYVVLDDNGPRILVHTKDVVLTPGTRAEVTGVSPEGDPVAELIDEVRP